MKIKSDQQLGMGREITRRDFIHDISLATLGLSLPIGTMAEVAGRVRRRWAAHDAPEMLIIRTAIHPGTRDQRPQCLLSERTRRCECSDALRLRLGAVLDVHWRIGDAVGNVTKLQFKTDAADCG